MEVVFGLVVWVLANLVYADMRRRGQGGFKRLVAFWLGWPGTFVALLVVDRRELPPIREDDEGMRGLMEEIRRERRLGSGRTDADSPAPPGTGSGGEVPQPRGPKPIEE